MGGVAEVMQYVNGVFCRSSSLALRLLEFFCCLVSGVLSIATVYTIKPSTCPNTQCAFCVPIGRIAISGDEMPRNGGSHHREMSDQSNFERW